MTATDPSRELWGVPGSRRLSIRLQAFLRQDFREKDVYFLFLVSTETDTRQNYMPRILSEAREAFRYQTIVSLKPRN